ncbi:MAG: DUF6702 family protein [Bacteroidia bacterium]
MNFLFLNILSYLVLLLHPIYLGITDIKVNEDKKEIEVSIKVFYDDFEKSLKKEFGKPIDLINNKNNDDLNSIISKYSSDNFQIKCNGKTLNQTFVGFENEKDITWIYLSFNYDSQLKTIELSQSFLYNSFEQQTHIIHLKSNDTKESGKIQYPNKSITFSLN